MRKGELEPNGGGNVAMEYAKEPTLPLGGGGLLSTAVDYTRFMQMMLNGGEFGGTRILAPSSVSMMRTNRLPAAIVNSTSDFGIGTFHVGPGQGFGLDFAVYTDPAFISHPVGKGTYSWGGAAGTWFWIDPANDIAFVGMVQRVVLAGSPDMGAIAQQAAYQALVNPEK